jgi:uncharacterized protein (DUF427 family)
LEQDLGHATAREVVMSRLLRTSLTGAIPELRHEPTAKRIRAGLGGRTVVDSRRALLVWEPRRVVPSWAVPTDDIDAAVTDSQPGAATGADVGHAMPDVSDRPVLDPSVPFAAHTAAGSPVDLAVDGQRLAGAGFRPEDQELAGYVVLDFAAFDQWWEEDVPALAHPRDPFHRIDVLPSSRSVRIELDGRLLAESAHPTLLFETLLPTRYYLPREDVRVPLTPTSTTSTCAYKGHASYWAPELGDEPAGDLAWSYEDPLPEAASVRGMIAFFNERVDLIVDGEKVDRPTTPWSRGLHRPSDG